MGKVALWTWLITALLGTAVMCAALSGMEGDMDPEILLLVAGVGLGISLVVSVPVMIIYHFILKGLVADRAPLEARLIASVYAVITPVLGVVLVLSAFSGVSYLSVSKELLIFCLPYSASFLLCVWVIRWPVPPAPDLLFADEEAQTGDELLPAVIEVPQTPFYMVIVLTGLSLVYSIMTTAVHGMSARFTGFSLLHFAGITVMSIGLVQFINKKPAGWKILAFFACAGLAGSVIGAATTVVTIGMAGQGFLLKYLLRVAVFILIDIVVIFHLSKPAVKSGYSIAAKDQWVWMFAGVGYGVLYALLSQILYRYGFHF